jgi:serine/threonine protein kinase
MSELKIESVTPYFEKNQEIKELLERDVEIIEDLLENMATKLGEGRTANAHFLDSNARFCLKILKKPGEMPGVPFYNSLEIEMGFLNELQELDSKVRVPKPYLAGDYKGNKFLIMETLNAHSIADILQGKGHLPENFNVADFYENLKSFVAKMHDRNVYHRDLHEGNIMINPETAEIYVIDFGASSRSYSDESAYFETRPTNTVRFTSDEDFLRSVYQSLRKHVLTNKK